MLLAIDTATRTASAALYDEAGVVGESTWRSRENHTTSLMPQVEQLLATCGATVEGLRAVAVATGPGSFTGLRIGMSAAKGLALVRGLPLIGVPTLDGLAHAFAAQPLPVWAVLEAGRGRFAAALYFKDGRRPERVGEYVFGKAEPVAAEMERRLEGNERFLVCGELDAALRAALRARLADRLVLADGASGVRRAAYLGELAWLRWQSNEVGDPDTLAPFYIPTAGLPQAVA